MPRFVRHYYGDTVCSSGYVRCFSWPGTRRSRRPALTRSEEVALLGDRGIKAYTPLPHAFRSGVTSVVGTQRQGIHRLLILSCRCYDCRSPRRT